MTLAWSFLNMDAKQEALRALDKAITLIYNVEGDRWQMAYDVLEAVLDNLKIKGASDAKLV